MVHGADAYYFVSETPDGRAGGIAKGLTLLNIGDVFVYEMQTGGVSNEYVPVDYNKAAVWDVTREALKAGILVVAAAGNGNVNLDDEVYDEYRNRPDNGIIRVGAGDEHLKKANFSTYGSMIHLQGWGTWNVVFAVVAVQSWYKEQTGKLLSPLGMRELLIETGMPQINEWWSPLFTPYRSHAQCT